MNSAPLVSDRLQGTNRIGALFLDILDFAVDFQELGK